MKAIDMTHIYGNKNYKGKWVAIKDFETRPKVVATGKTLKETMESATQKGYQLPLMMKVPKKILPFVGAPQILR